MSCDTPAGNFSHLDIGSTIDVEKCKLGRGASARHSVKLTNYAAVEIEVEIECACPAGCGLQHVRGNPWRPPPRSLLSSVEGVDSTTFDEDLCAADDAGAPTRQQLKLTVRRRRLHATRWAACKTIPLKDIEVV
jgi:hypothetical protein